jgi:hypothetical protein
MCRNLTAFERMARVLIGFAIVLVALGFEPPHPWLALFAIIPVGTAILGYCPLYQLVGYNPLKRSTQ